MRLKRIQDQVVVLMGATSGIGLETARLMAQKGARVAIIGRSQEGLNEALDQVRRYVTGTWSQRVVATGGGEISSGAPGIAIEDQVIGLEADATNFDQLKAAADQVAQRFGGIDTWVNLSAVAEYAMFDDTTPDEFRRVVEVNLLGQSYGAMAALPYLKRQPSAALIFLSSINARMPLPYQAAYNASKQGLIGLADTLRLELGYAGIPVSVTTILPASINTPMFDKARTRIGVEPRPIPPVYEVRMTAEAILYAAQHPVRELIVGDAGYMINLMSRIAPTLTSQVVGRMSFRSQMTDQEKSAEAPDNLYEHIEGYDQAQGDFGGEAMRFSPITYLSTHPRARAAVYGGVLAGAGALIAWRVISQRRQEDRQRQQSRRGWQGWLDQGRQSLRQAPGLVKESSRQYSQQAMKATQQALEGARGALAEMPVVSNLPMFRTNRTFFERAVDVLLGAWAALTSISLPMLRRRRQPVTRRVAVRFNAMSSQAARQAAKAADQVKDQAAGARAQVQKNAQKAVRVIKDQAPRDGHNPVVMRGQSLIEKMPFGERGETTSEK